jgi:hypothetical protein
MILQQITKPTDWHIQQLARSDRGIEASSSSYRNAVESGNAILFEAVFNYTVKGCVLIRIEQFENGNKEVVIVACGGKLTLAELRETMRQLIFICRKFESIRTHVQRPALIRVWQNMGFKQDEVVMRLKNG